MSDCLIVEGDQEEEYRGVIEKFVHWSNVNGFLLNVAKLRR